jgi:ribosomal protein S18 acetylase RimI-like enzyme
MLRLDAASGRVHPEEHHWFLQAIGVDGGIQGQGIGTQLLAPVVDRASAGGTPCYLYTSNPRTLRLYSRLGFEVTRDIHLLRGGPLTWTMWRRP